MRSRHRGGRRLGAIAPLSAMGAVLALAGCRTAHPEDVPMVPSLFRVILPVGDVDRAASFYEQVLGTAGRRVSPGRHYFDCGGTILACYDAVRDGDATVPGPNPEHVYFAVDDLEAVFARCRTAGCQRLDDGPVQQPWGERSFYAADPFGNPLCFVDRRTVFTGR